MTGKVCYPDRAGRLNTRENSGFGERGRNRTKVGRSAPLTFKPSKPSKPTSRQMTYFPSLPPSNSRLKAFQFLPAGQAAEIHLESIFMTEFITWPPIVTVVVPDPVTCSVLSARKER